MATRRKILPLVLEIARASGAVVVFDDLHKPSYHEEVRRRLKELGATLSTSRPIPLTITADMPGSPTSGRSDRSPR